MDIAYLVGNIFGAQIFKSFIQDYDVSLYEQLKL